MSTTVLQVSIKVGGVLVDADGQIVTITTPGVTRMDTGGVVAASPITMTRASVGVYQYLLTDPAYDLVYQFPVMWTQYGVPQGPIQITVTGTLSPVTTSYYCDQNQGQSNFGVFNVAVWSNKDDVTPTDANGRPVADPVQIAQAMMLTDNSINQLARLYNRQSPIPNTINAFGYLQDLANQDWPIRLYRARGSVQSTSDHQGAQLSETWKMLWGDGTMKCKGAFRAFFTNWQAIMDAPRSVPQSQGIEVVMSPAVVGYGSTNNIVLPSSYIPTIPNSNT